MSIRCSKFAAVVEDDTSLPPPSPEIVDARAIRSFRSKISRASATAAMDSVVHHLPSNATHHKNNSQVCVRESNSPLIPVNKYLFHWDSMQSYLLIFRT